MLSVCHLMPSALNRNKRSVTSYKERQSPNMQEYKHTSAFLHVCVSLNIKHSDSAEMNTALSRHFLLQVIWFDKSSPGGGGDKIRAMFLCNQTHPSGGYLSQPPHNRFCSVIDVTFLGDPMGQSCDSQQQQQLVNYLKYRVPAAGSHFTNESFCRPPTWVCRYDCLYQISNLKMSSLLANIQRYI